MTPSMEARIAEYAAAPTPPSPLSPWSSPLTSDSLTTLPTSTLSLHLPPTCTQSLRYHQSPITASYSLPHQSTVGRTFPKAGVTLIKGYVDCSLLLWYEVGESSIAAPRPTGGHRVDYGFIGTLDSKTRCQRAEEVSYGIRDV
ncbi:hypothetical protein Tco_0447901 [Tanacetum coccineum]